MGSIRPNAATKRLVLISSLVALLFSCRPPNLYLHLLDESGYGKKELAMRLLDGDIFLGIKSHSMLSQKGFGPSCNRYDLRLYLSVKGPKTGHDLSVAPGAIQVLAGDSIMAIHHNYPEHRIDTLSSSEFYVRACFELKVDRWSPWSFGNLPVRIALDGFLTFDGEPVAIDTVRAVETKDCDYD